jgi:SAM-dependent methyltransferase
MTSSSPPAPLLPAEVYDTRFVPALFGPWGDRVCDLAGIGPSQDVLDVACGTGALTRAAAERVGTGGRVVGLDSSPEMLAVAGRKDVRAEWREGRAEELPFPDASFDRVVSQFGFMFFQDPVRALREMARVMRPQGRLVVAVCDGLDHSPGYAVLTELLHRLFGADVAQAFRAPFVLGDRRRLAALATAAALDAEGLRVEGSVAFDSVGDLVSTERACAWTLGGLRDEAQFERLEAEAQESLRPFTEAGGTVSFGMPCLCLVAGRPAAA